MNQIRKKLQKFQIEIRRSDRQRILSKYRNNLMNALAFDDLLEKFKLERPQEVSQDFLDGLSIQSKQSVQALLSFFQGSQISFFQTQEKWPQQWFFNCRNRKNLMLATFLEKTQNNSPFIKAFFEATIRAHQKYKIASNRYEIQVRNSKCLIRSQKTELNLSPQQNLLQVIYNNSNEETFLATLQFWATYIDEESNFIPNDYIIMLKTFMLWYEHTNISKYQETYFFLNEMLKFFEQADLFEKVHNVTEQLNIEALLLIDKIKRTISSAHMTLLFKQVGQVTIRLIIFSQCIPEILSELLYRSQTMMGFIKKMFMFDLQMANLQQISVGIRLVYFLLNAGMLNFCSQDDRNIIFTKIFKQYCFHPKLQFYVVFTLTDLAYFDNYNKMQTYFEELPFQRIYQIEHLSQEVIHKLSLAVLQNYRQNYKICDQIFNKCDLVSRLRDFSQRIEDDQGLFQRLTKIVDSSIAFFVDNFLQYVEQIREYACDLEFEGKGEFLKESQKYIELKFKQQRI